LTGDEKDANIIANDEGEEPWIELLDRIDSSNFSKLFRNMVLTAGLLHLRKSSESALRDLQTIIQETSKFSQRIASATEKHPEVKVLKSIESNLGEFSTQTEGFHKALLASEMRGELELLSLSLLISRSASPGSIVWKAKLAKRITRLARHMKLKDERLKEKYLLSPGESFTKEDGSRERDKGNSGTN
jgi:hypothetical protein